MEKAGAKTSKTKPKASKKTPAKPRQGTSKKTTAIEKARKKQEKKDVIAIDLCGVKLTAMQCDFIVNYVTPGQPGFHNAYQAALKAGYAEAVAKSNIYGLLQNPDIQKIIRANERLIHNAVHSAALRALEAKQQRAFFDPIDYFEEKEITVETKEGEYTKSIMALKSLKDMTPEQRMCIDGIDIKGQASIPVYLMPDRGKELNDIIKIDGDYSKSASDGDSEEETLEIIMERLTVKKTIRKTKDEISETANLIKPPKGNAITEL